MELADCLRAAGIIKIAIVDDDLSPLICTEDLRTIDPDVAGLLNDANDPDNASYLQLLIQRGEQLDNLDDIAAPLGDPVIREEAPARLRTAAERVLEVRNGNAISVQRVRTLLESAGILRENIDTYFTPHIPENKFYDLIIVDYFLVNESKDHTVPFLKKIVQTHSNTEKSLQLILMSSHEHGLKADFQILRPEMNVSSSRMRILAKPQSDDQMLSWELILAQLATERTYIPAIESFVTEAIRSIKQAAEDQTSKLWGLDLQAMNTLYETAIAGNDDYCRYVEECLSRHLLTRLEEIQTLRAALDNLREVLSANRDGSVIAPGVEIGDSRVAIRNLMTSMEWRGGEPAHPPYPTDASQNDKARWVKAALRFGTVLKCPNGHDWLNLTQSCDLLQAKEAELDSTCLLLIRGYRNHPSSQAKGQATVQMGALMVDGDTTVLWWNLGHVLTPTINSFGSDFNNGWQVSSELRLDQAQHVAARYASLMSRVGLQSTVKSWVIQGVAMKTQTLLNANDFDEITGTPVMGQALRREKSDELHIDLRSLSLLKETFGGELANASFALCRGVQIKPTKKNTDLNPILHYVDEVPLTMGGLREKFYKDSQASWLSKPANADKVLLFVWSS